MYRLLAISGLSLVLLSGAAYSQTSGNATGNAGVNAGATVGDTSANVGVNAGTAGAASTGNGNTTAGANANTGVAVGASSGNNSASGTASGTAATGTATGTNNASTTTTASGSTSAQAAIGGLGAQGSGFFADSSQSTANSPQQIQATFNALAPAQQEQIRQACAGAAADDASVSGKICTAIKAM